MQKKLLLIIFFVLTSFIIYSNSIHSVVHPDHSAYAVINDFTNRKLLIAPEIYKEGAVLTRKDFGVLAVMLLTNTDDKLYIEKLSYYDIKSILDMVIEFSDEINFFFSPQIDTIIARLKKLEKKIEIPMTSLESAKKVEMPKWEVRKADPLKTTSIIELGYESTSSTDLEGYKNYYPERGEKDFTQLNLEVRSLDALDETGIFQFNFYGWYKGSEAEGKAKFVYNDPDFKVKYSALGQDNMFVFHSGGIDEDYAYAGWRDYYYIRRFNHTDDVRENLYGKKIGNFSLNYSMRDFKNAQRKGVFASADFGEIYGEIGKAEIYANNVKINEPMAIFAEYDTEKFGGRLQFEFSMADMNYSLGRNMYSYSGNDRMGDEKTRISLNYGRKIVGDMFAGMVFTNDESDNNDFYYENFGLFLSNYSEMSWNISYFNTKEFSTYADFAKNTEERTDTFALSLNRSLGRYDSRVSYIYADNEDPYMNINRNVTNIRAEITGNIMGFYQAAIYHDYTTRDNVNANLGGVWNEEKNNTGTYLYKDLGLNRTLNIKADYISSTGYREYNEGKFFAGINFGNGRLSGYEAGYEYIDHSDKTGPDSFENHTVFLKYRRHF